MASAAKRLITADEFLSLEFSGGEGFRVELDNGVISMMAGGNLRHAGIQRNLLGILYRSLMGTGCSAYGSDIGVRTHNMSLRYPDVTIICGYDGKQSDALCEIDDPRVVIEILSPSTRRLDIETKLREYCATASLSAIIYIDPDAESIRFLTRNAAGGWHDRELTAGADIVMSSPDVVLHWADVFARG